MRLVPHDPLVHKQQQIENVKATLDISVLSDQDLKPRTKREANKVTFSPVAENRSKLPANMKPPTTANITTASGTTPFGKTPSALKNSSKQG